jgi:peptidoglycan/LPS O-acetylase OafA/YrhL
MTVRSAQGQPALHRGLSGGGHYRPDVDGLRAVAVGAVVAYHAFPDALPGGFIGVDVFFVISGYLISGIILGALRDRRFTFANFYARRIRRIFPALALVLMAVMAAGWFTLYADDYQRLGRHVAAGAAFASNLVLWQESSYFDTAAELKPLLHLWSLGIEEQFYLAWPLLLVIASRWTRGPMLLTLALGTASFFAAIWTVRIDPTAAFFAPWTRFWELLAGASLACTEIDRELQVEIDRLRASRWLANALAIAGAIMIGAGVVLIDATRLFPGFWVLLPVAGSFLLILTGQRAWLNRSILSYPPVVWVGLISYPLYLWHWPLLSFARIIAGAQPGATIRLSIIAASVLLSWLTYRIVEWPIRFGAPARRLVPSLSAAMVALFAIGLAATATGGWIERPINRSDAAHLVDFYERMRKDGLREAYRVECDFMDWVSEDARATLDPSCTAAGESGTVLLWGDSFAQSLSLGLREQLPPGISLAQVATSACVPAIENFVALRGRRCEKANLYAMDSIRRLRPKLVILVQSGDHQFVDWPRVAARVIELGAGHAIITGPFPVWRPTLPRVVAQQYMDNPAAYISTGVDQDLFTADREVAAMLRGLPYVTYVSLLQRLCRGNACLARVPGESDLDLMAVDHGHLTPKASAYVGRVVFKPHLDRLLAR